MGSNLSVLLAVGEAEADAEAETTADWGVATRETAVLCPHAQPQSVAHIIMYTMDDMFERRMVLILVDDERIVDVVAKGDVRVTGGEMREKACQTSEAVERRRNTKEKRMWARCGTRCRTSRCGKECGRRRAVQAGLAL